MTRNNGFEEKKSQVCNIYAPITRLSGALNFTHASVSQDIFFYFLLNYLNK